MAFLSGCASESESDSQALVGTSYGDACTRIKYEGESMKPYRFSRLRVAVCVPGRVTATRLKRTGSGKGERVLFAGFAVPPGTNLESKELTVYQSRYPGDLGSISLGTYVAHKVKYLCTKKYERSAGYVTMHVIYSGEGPTFDFAHRASVAHGRYRAKYDEAAQIRLTRIIMHTYRELPNERVVITCFNSVPRQDRPLVGEDRDLRPDPVPLRLREEPPQRVPALAGRAAVHDQESEE